MYLLCELCPNSNNFLYGGTAPQTNIDHILCTIQKWSTLQDADIIFQNSVDNFEKAHNIPTFGLGAVHP